MSASNLSSGVAASPMRMEQTIYPRFRWFMLVTVTFGYFAAGVFLIIFAPILGVAAQEFGITIGEATLLLITTFVFSNAVATIASGPLIDRFGVRPCIILGGVLTVLAALSIPLLGGSLSGVVAMRVLLGLGFGPVSACVSAVAARWFPPPERGLVAGVQGSGIALGIALTFGAMPAALQAYHGNWRAGMSWFVIVAVIGLVLCLLTLLGKEPAPAGTHATDAGDFKLALRQPAFYLGAASMLGFAWIMNAFNSLTPAYLSVPAPLGIGMGLMTAGKLMAGVQLGMIIGSVVAGVLVGKVFKGNARPVLVVGFLFAAVFMFSVKFPFVNGNSTVLALCLFLAGFFESFIAPGVSTFIAVHYPYQIVGRVFAISFGLCLFGGTIGVAVGGTILHYTNSFQWPITVVGLVAVIGVLVSALLKPPAAFAGRH